MGDVSDALILPIFEALDASQTDEIHYSEFLAAMVSTKIEMHDDLLSKAFSRFDHDNTGYIDAKNLRHILGDTYDEGTVDQLMKDAELGDNTGRIWYDDFVMHLKDCDASDVQNTIAETIIDQEMQCGSSFGCVSPSGCAAIDANWPGEFYSMRDRS